MEHPHSQAIGHSEERPARTQNPWEDPMQVNRTRAAVLAFGAVLFGTSLATGIAQAQAPAPPAAAASNDLQRSVEVYGYNAAAKSGPGRGEVIYYYKCW